MTMENLLKSYQNLPEDEKAKFMQSIMSKKSDCGCSPAAMGKMSDMMSCCMPMSPKKNDK